MKCYKKLNLLEDKKMIIKLNVWSIPLMLVLGLIFTILAIQIRPNDFADFSIYFLILFMGVYFLLLIIHELIHGFFFKRFEPKNRVKFGFKNGMAYATSPGSIYPKSQFLVIVLAPFFVITTVLFTLFLVKAIAPLTFIFLASVHGAGCIGDFYFAFLLSKLPQDVHVEDTEVGIDFYFPVDSPFWLDK
ncbi:DUF3267 domain-containing protein [Vagococcus silagei]|uniref:DUF3267 domain-containing protein n=1 Tax=Vagococcus silagei TaxID=2508885 RepID=A0A4S3B475_9ENTE|nr:DUF3267 domain-containing protein [Vagococcus silagei]THB61057.1 DUF3267 domain-containing protein [Vagococcus silagei]